MHSHCGSARPLPNEHRGREQPLVLGPGMWLELLPLASAGTAESGSDVSTQHFVVRGELQLVIKVSLLGQDLALMLDSCKLLDIPLTPP